MEIIKSDAIKAHGARNRNRYYIIVGLPKGGCNVVNTVTRKTKAFEILCCQC